MRATWEPAGMDGGTPSSSRPLRVRADTHHEISDAVLLNRIVNQIKDLVGRVVTSSRMYLLRPSPVRNDGLVDLFGTLQWLCYVELLTD